VPTVRGIVNPNLLFPHMILGEYANKTT